MKIKRALRSLRDTPVARTGIRFAFYGRSRHCPCCGTNARKFRGVNDPRVPEELSHDRYCWVCGSSERHRALCAYLDLHPELLWPGMSILHIAPEHALLQRINAVPGVHYRGGDIDAYFSKEVIDVTDLHQFGDATFDAVICNHVLEHVPDDRTAMRELRRVLKRGGWGFLLVPDVQPPAPGSEPSVTQEDLSITDPAERIARYGQSDHVRLYGWDYIDRLESAGFSVTAERQSEIFAPEQIQRFRLAKFHELEPLFVVR